MTPQEKMQDILDEIRNMRVDVKAAKFALESSERSLAHLEEELKTL